MNNYDLIREAIINKQYISCSYNGYYREMCPHTIGTKNGKAQALFYQFGGKSKSGLSTDPKNNWRCIPVNEITNIQVHSGKWYTADNHNQSQSCIDNVDIEIVY